MSLTTTYTDTSLVLGLNPAEALDEPLLALPAHESVDVARDVSLQWHPVDEAESYEMQVATDQSFEQLIVNETSLSDTTLSVADLSPSTNYHWRVRAAASDLVSEWSAVFTFTTETGVSADVDEAFIPAAFGLGQNYPNPFQEITTISVDVPEHAHVLVQVFNVLGRNVQTLSEGSLAAGRHDLQLRAEGLPSGTYFVRTRSGQHSETRTMMLLR